MNNKSMDMHHSILLPPPPSYVKSRLLAKPILIQEQDVFLLKKTFYQIYEKQKDFFILQIGDCAESFEDCTEEIVFQKCQFYNDTAQLLEKHLQKEVVLIGRIAGQYAKPRTDDFEQKNGCVLPSYRGDMINSHEFDEIARKPNASRMLQAYECAQNTLKFMDAFYHLHQNKKIFTSHEALMLDYEYALTRACTYNAQTSHHNNLFLNGSAHTVWLGDRSRNLSADHIEYLSTIENPIGIKIGPHQSPETLVSLLEKLNPLREEGKIYLITRLGVENVKTLLPKLIEVVLAANFPVLWCVDPMHGNTFKLDTGRKVRTVYDIAQEYLFTSEIHQNMGTVLSGLHLEATFLPVTECIVEEKAHATLCDYTRYMTKCDPRLNPEQVHTLINSIHR